MLHPLSEKRNFIQLWLLRLTAGESHCWGQECRASSQADGTCLCVNHTHASSVVDTTEGQCAGASGWLMAQSRARSGWVFSFSPFSSCFRVPASTTDCDLERGQRKRHNYKLFIFFIKILIYIIVSHHQSISLKNSLESSLTAVDKD